MFQFTTKEVPSNTFQVTVEPDKVYPRDVNILINGHRVAFFDGNAGELCLVKCDSQLALPLDEGGYIVVDSA